MQAMQAMEKMSGIIERLKEGEGLHTKSIPEIARGHGLPLREAVAVLAFHLCTGKLVEDEDGYWSTCDGPLEPELWDVTCFSCGATVRAQDSVGDDGRDYCRPCGEAL